MGRRKGSKNRIKREPDQDLRSSGDDGSSSYETDEENDVPSSRGYRDKNDYVCSICEKEGDLLLCDGPCLSSFHIECLGLKDLPDDDMWLCKDCKQRQHRCFYCKVRGPISTSPIKASQGKSVENQVILKKCCAISCGKFYHVRCIRSLPLARVFGQQFICPLHTCATCQKSGESNHSVRCTRCPTAYHSKCVPRKETKRIMSKRIICPKHTDKSPASEMLVVADKTIQETNVISETGKEVLARDKHGQLDEGSPITDYPHVGKKETEKVGDGPDISRKRKISSEGNGSEADKSPVKKPKRESDFADDDDEEAVFSPPKSILKGTASADTPAALKSSGSAESNATPEIEGHSEKKRKKKKKHKRKHSKDGREKPTSEELRTNGPTGSAKNVNEKTSKEKMSSVGKDDTRKSGVQDHPKETQSSTLTEDEAKKKALAAMLGDSDDDDDDIEPLTAENVVNTTTKSAAAPTPTPSLPEKDMIKVQKATDIEPKTSSADYVEPRPPRSPESAIPDSPKKASLGDQPQNLTSSVKSEAPETTQDATVADEKKGRKPVHLKPIETDPKALEAQPPTPSSDTTPQNAPDSNGYGQRSGRAAAAAANNKLMVRTQKKKGKQADKVSKKEMRVEDEVPWVQCDSCKKWRTVAKEVDLSSLPDQWYCRLNTWNETYSVCTAPEEEIRVSPIKPSPKRATPRSTKKSPVNDPKGKNYGLPDVDTAIDSTTPRDPSSLGKDKSRKRKLKEMQWVQCESESCGKWRAVPPAINLASLPEKWYCALNTWSPNLASCSAANLSDEEAFLKKKGKTKGGKVKQGRPAKKQKTEKEPKSEGGKGAKSLDSSSSKPGGKKKTRQTVWQWVQCEKCEKWRRLAPTIDISTLPEKWYCSLNTWDKSRASCDVDEDEDDGSDGDGPDGSNINWNAYGVRKDKGKLCYRELIYSSNGLMRKAYSAEASMGYDKKGNRIHRDDQYRKSSLYCSPTKSTRPKENGAHVQNQATPDLNDDQSQTLDDMILNELTRYTSTATELSIAVQCASQRTPTVNASLFSNKIISRALNELVQSGKIEKIESVAQTKGFGDPESYYRKARKKPLKACKPWKSGRFHLDVDWE